MASSIRRDGANAEPGALCDDATATPWWRQRRSVFILLVVFYATLVGSVWRKGVTFDEPRHATAGYSYWTLGDYRLDPETGVLANLIAAAPLLAFDNPFPSLASDAWRTADERRMGDLWFNQSSADTIGMVHLGRAFAALFAVGLAVLTWHYARRLGGAVAAIIALVLFVLNPTVLANGALMTSEILVSALFLGSIMLIWKLTHEITVARVLVSAISVAALFAVKNSALSIIPVAVILVIIRLVSNSPLAVNGFGQPRLLSARVHRLVVMGTVAAVHIAVGFALIWTFYSFRFSAFATHAATDRFPITWEEILGAPSPSVLADKLALTTAQIDQVAGLHLTDDLRSPKWTNAAANAYSVLRGQILTPAQMEVIDATIVSAPADLPQRVFRRFLKWRLLPEGYLFGLSQTWFYSHGYPSFLNGAVNLDGSVWFFPYTFLVKTPLVTLLLLFAAVVCAATFLIRSARAEIYRTTPLWVFIATYTAICLSSHLNIGHRHLLPIYAPCCILIGVFLVRRWDFLTPTWRRRSRVILIFLLVVQAGEILGRFPNYLAYFNGIVLPSRGYQHLVDSSLDWGQELPAVARYIARHQGSGDRNYLAYFGLDRPQKYGISAAPLFSLPGFYAEDKLLAGTRVSLHPTPQEMKGVRERWPDFELAGLSPSGEFQDLLLLRRAENLQLQAGVYFIGATMLQPVYYQPWRGAWNDRYETDYQRFRAEFAPFLIIKGSARAQLVARANLVQLEDDWAKFREVRFARLTAFLRQREPDEQINDSVLVYRLSADDLAAALEGPAPRS